MPTHPNPLFIFADQHRHDAMGCAGNRLAGHFSWPDSGSPDQALTS